MQELPLVRLNLIVPILEALMQRGSDAEAVLASFGLNSLAVYQSGTFVPAPLMYKLVETLCAASGDAHFGVHVGETLDPFAWPPLAEAMIIASTLGDLLLRFTLTANEHASSMSYAMEIRGERCMFSGRRISHGGLLPSHNDGFTIAYLLRLVKSALASAWDGTEVLAKVCDPAAVPRGYLNIRVADTDAFGPSISFPSRWLLLPVNFDKPGREAVLQQPEPPALDSLKALRQTLRPLLNRSPLEAQQVADLFGISKRTLARLLSDCGTSFSKELALERRLVAEKLLSHSKLSIAQVGASIGYQDAAVFSRAFRRWTSISPSEFRHQASKA